MIGRAIFVRWVNASTVRKSRADKVLEERMRLQRLGLELGVELAT